MFSAKLMTDLELVCRCVRGSNTVYGGLQVVLVGDFFQLPPVPNARYNDAGLFAYDSPIWGKAFVHKVLLKNIHRQREPVLKQVSQIGPNRCFYKYSSF